MFALDLLKKKPTESNNRNGYHIVGKVTDPDAVCVACDNRATVIRRENGAWYTIDLPRCDSCTRVLWGEVEVIIFQRLNRRRDK